MPLGASRRRRYQRWDRAVPVPDRGRPSGGGVAPGGKATPSAKWVWTSRTPVGPSKRSDALSTESSPTRRETATALAPRQVIADSTSARSRRLPWPVPWFGRGVKAVASSADKATTKMRSLCRTRSARTGCTCWAHHCSAWMVSSAIDPDPFFETGSGNWAHRSVVAGCATGLLYSPHGAAERLPDQGRLGRTPVAAGARRPNDVCVNPRGTGRARPPAPFGNGSSFRSNRARSIPTSLVRIGRRLGTRR
jgi:hypothetical protein